MSQVSAWLRLRFADSFILMSKTVHFELLIFCCAVHISWYSFYLFCWPTNRGDMHLSALIYQLERIMHSRSTIHLRFPPNLFNIVTQFKSLSYIWDTQMSYLYILAFLKLLFWYYQALLNSFLFWIIYFGFSECRNLRSQQISKAKLSVLCLELIAGNRSGGFANIRA